MTKLCIGLLLLLPLGLNAEEPKTLFDAVNANDLGKVVAMLDSGADVNKRNEAYMNATPLMVAMGKNNLEMTRVLLKAGADIDAIDENGDPAINWAAYYGLTEQVNLLLENGASTQMVGHGNTLDIAMRRGHQALVFVLAQHDGIAEDLAPAAIDLQAAIDADNPQAAELAISKGAQANGLDETGRPFIARAARNGSINVIRLLIKHGAVIDAEDPIGFTPLMEVARVGDVKTMSMLLDVGADPNHTSFKRGLSFTPLHQAAVGGEVEALWVLLNADAKIDPVDSIGNTPAMWALFEGKLDFCLAALKAGSDPNIKNESGMSLASAAREYKVKEVVAWMDDN